MDLQALLAETAARHSHLCPRQVLGVRAGLAGIDTLELPQPLPPKRLLIILETDGCFADGVEVSTHVSVGHRTLRIEDYGKTAATFIDTKTGVTLRISTRLDIRQRAWDYAPQEEYHYQAMLLAYQKMPAAELFNIQPVTLTTPLEDLISRAGIRADCDLCGEEVINEREVTRNGITLCRACAGSSYYIETPPFKSVDLSIDTSVDL